MPIKNIHLYIQSFTHLLQLSVQDFSSRRSYNQYLKQKIRQYRSEIIGEFIHVPISELHYAIEDQGKPYLKNQQLSFNHSYNQQNYALVLSLNVRDLGVDIESLQRKVRFDALAQHAFHPQEYQRWKTSGENPLFWFQVWTTKEAILKACGLGIRMNLNELNTNVMFGEIKGRCEHAELGRFGYQHFECAGVIITVAWREMLQENPEIILHID